MKFKYKGRKRVVALIISEGDVLDVSEPKAIRVLEKTAGFERTWSRKKAVKDGDKG